MHFNGFRVSVYWATFPSDYLLTVRLINVDCITHTHPKIKLYHTQTYNLMDTVDRTDFIKEFVALLRFVAAGEAKIGHLRKDSQVIHRTTADIGAVKDEVVLRPPQEALDEDEEEAWRLTEANEYAA